MELNKTKGFLHTHTERSRMDSGARFADIAKKAKELGADTVAVTDHGVLSGIEDAKIAFRAQGVKLIPGVEAYVEEDEESLTKRMHLILLAKDDIGYKAICKAVTESNKRLRGTFKAPCMNKDILHKYFGKGQMGHNHVFTTSACIGGVINSILLLNDKIKKEEQKLINKKNNIAVSEEMIADTKKMIKDSSDKIIKLKEAKAETERIAKRTFKKRENQLAKITDPDEHNEFLKVLNDDKEESKKAVEKLLILRNDIKTEKTRLTKNNNALKDLLEKMKKYTLITQKIQALHYYSEDELYAKAKAEALNYQNIFGKQHFLLEIQYHGIDAEKYAMPIIAKIAKDTNIPLIAANDSHMVSGTDKERLQRQLLRSLAYGKFEEEIPGDSELYMKSNEELLQWLSKIIPRDEAIGAINNIDIICNACNVEFKHEDHYPKFASYNGETADEMLDDAIKVGIRRRFPSGMDQKHIDRLKRELNTIQTMGYSDYHLIVQDFLTYGRLLGYVPEDKIFDAPLTIESLRQWIKENGWKNPGLTIGPGRGSAGGSLACYILGITNLDPLDYNLLFERFLNVERVSMPDIDSDLAYNVREQVIKYVTNKYGQNAVCGIMTVDSQKPRGAIRMAARFYGSRKDGRERTAIGDYLANKVPKEPGTTFKTLIDPDKDNSDTVYEYVYSQIAGITAEPGEDLAVKKDEAYKIMEWAEIIEGSFTAYGAHAAGVVISDNQDISDYTPLRWNTTKNQWTTQCNMTQVEKNGLLKMDFLGLVTLNIFTFTLKSIEKRTGKIIDLLACDRNDAKVFKHIFQNGNTNAIFQVESPGMKNMLIKLHPTRFEDLILAISIFRPGPMAFIPEIIDWKWYNEAKVNGQPTWKHYKGNELIMESIDTLPQSSISLYGKIPALDAILSPTYGCPVYQEQIMQIFQEMAGYSLGQADLVRRAMSHKQDAEIAKERQSFIHGDPNRNIEGAVAKHGVSVKDANALFDQMMPFAKYGFNKSHAASYALNAYLEAYLKYYYPIDFFAGTLTWTTTDKLPNLINNAKQNNVKILCPDINISDTSFKIQDDNIIFGLSMIKQVGKTAADIEEARKAGPFRSFYDFYSRVKPDASSLSNLIDTGALDRFNSNRQALHLEANRLKALGQSIAGKTKNIDMNLVLKELVTCCDNDDDFQAMQEEKLGKIKLKKWTAPEKMQDKIDKYNADIEALTNEMSVSEFQDPKEDKVKKLNLEKELLGTFLSGNPMDEYPEPKLLGTVPISDINLETKVFIGVISNFEIKFRKKDGAPMAFFDVEDKSGSIHVCCFNQAFERLKESLDNGKILKFIGVVNDDNDEYQFYLENIRSINTIENTVLYNATYTVKNTIAMNKIAQVLKPYKSDNGIYTLVIAFKNYDDNGHEFYEPEYSSIANCLLSDKVLELPNVSVI